MFGLFDKKDPDRCPVNEDSRLWIEKSFSVLLTLFDKKMIKERKILLPHYTHFPIKYNGDTQTATATLKIVAAQMEVAFDDIVLNFYDEGTNAISTDGMGGRIFLRSEENEKKSAGLYWGKQEDNKYHIGLERRKLAQPENMVATLAHEIAHIKLLGEGRMENADEKFTDLVTVIFGLGIFSANGAFQTFTTVTSSGWRKLGYLSQMEWGYALALLAHIREEKAPGWMEYLTINVKSDFKQGQRFIENNESFDFQYKE